MRTTPDAPWIREAELNGTPVPPTPKCPACGRECDTYYTQDGDILGCEHCVETQDAWDWAARNR